MTLGIAGSPTMGQTVVKTAPEARTTFDNSLAPAPSQVASTAKAVQIANLGSPVEVQIPLKLRNQAKLTARIAQGEILSRAELERDYLPLASDYDAVQSWLASQGFQITYTDSSRLSLFAVGSVAQIQQSFHVTMGEVTVNGASYHSAQTSPSLPSAIAGPVLGINGLQPYLKAHPGQGVSRTNAVSGGYKVRDILTAYNANGLGVTGSGQKIAIMIDTVPSSSDLTAFWSANGVSQSLSNIESVNVTGVTLPPVAGEETLDVEWSSSIAPGAKVRVYAAGSLNFTDLYKCLQRLINDLPVESQIHQLSISLGLGETYLSRSMIQTESAYYATLAASGVSVFVSSGDSGSSPDGTLQVEYESSDPNVTGVGGTTLNYSPTTGLVASEVAWGNYNAGAWEGGGGGISRFFARPSWQQGAGVISGTARLVPDVAAVAGGQSPAYVFFQGRAVQFYGTSWSAPTWAGFCALINSARANAGLPPAGLLNPKIYPLLGSSCFRDITAGNIGDYAAGPGYDMATGLGVPNVQQLLQTLSNQSTGAPSITGFNPISGPISTSVAISGMNLANATSVSFNGGSTTSFTASATQLVVNVPGGASTGSITVFTPTGNTTSSGAFTVLSGVAANDKFSIAQTLSSTSGTATGSNVGATKETAEPNHAGNAGGHSVWYVWQAPQTGIYTWDTAGSSFDTLLAVYTGNDVASLTAVAQNDDASTAVTTSLLTFQATAGTVYRIAVDGYQPTGLSGAAGSIALHWVMNAASPAISTISPAQGSVGTQVKINGANFNGATSVNFNGTAASFTVNSPTQIIATVPSGATTGPIGVTASGITVTTSGFFTVTVLPFNDNFANAHPIAGISGTATGSTVGATKETAEPSHAGNSGGHSIWYGWTAPSTASYVIDTFGSSFDTLLAVYTGTSLGSLKQSASNDDAGPGGTSCLTFAAASGSTYWIAVDGYGGLNGAVVLHWADAGSIPAIVASAPNSAAVGASVVISGSQFTSVTGVQFNGVNASFVINSGSQITATVPNDATTGPIELITPSGATVSAAIFNVASTPANDLFANRTIIPAWGGTLTGSNVGATKETNEPSITGNAGGASVWWSWTAPASGTCTISTAGSTLTSGGALDTLLGVFTGTVVSNLTLIAADDDTITSPITLLTSLVNFNAVAGTTYQIVVDGYSGKTGNITLNVSPSYYPVINDFYPTSASVGSSVVISGSLFTGVTSVQFNGITASFSVDSDNQITATVPDGATSGPITLVNSTGSTMSFATFVVSGGTVEGPVTLFSTGFETSEGYSSYTTLSGQNYWLGPYGGNGIVNGAFAGQGQQAYVGFDSAYSGSTLVDLWQPLYPNYTPAAGETVVFSAAFQIQDSTNGAYDNFEWVVYSASNSVICVGFNNSTKHIYYWIDDGTTYSYYTGVNFSNGKIYNIEITMDLFNNRWSASLDGTNVVSNESISTVGSSLSLADVDAIWKVSGNGNNRMLFDNYKIVRSGTGSDFSWASRAVGTSNDLERMAYGNGRFVAVGDGGFIATSLDGVTWTPRTSGVSLNLYAVTWGGGNFVAVGSSGTILVSQDGVNWAPRNSFSSYSSLWGVAYNNGTFAAVGSGGKILTSTDTVTWTSRSAGTSNGLCAVDAANGMFVAAGQAGTVVTSQDGINWIFRNSGTTDTIESIANSGPGGIFVAVGYNGTIITSSDGITWSYVSSGTATDLWGVAYGCGSFVAVGPGGTVMASTDGWSWSPCNFTDSSNLYGVVYGNGLFVTSGGGTYGNGALYTSGTPNAKYFEITATAGGGGSASGSQACSQSNTATVTAVPSSGNQFTCWTEYGSVVSGAASYSFPVTANRNLVANFAPIPPAPPVVYSTLATASALPSGGSVSGGGTYPNGSVVSVTATPNLGYSFVGWMLNGNVVSTSRTLLYTVTGNQTLLANFKAQGHVKLTLVPSPTSAGKITFSPKPGRDGKYVYGTVVTLRARPNSGYKFKSWGSNASGNANPLRLPMEGNMKVKANFGKSASAPAPAPLPLPIKL